jgi:hypothetical protein
MIGEARSRERVFAMTTAILDAKTHEFDRVGHCGADRAARDRPHR